MLSKVFQWLPEETFLSLVTTQEVLGSHTCDSDVYISVLVWIPKENKKTLAPG